jgi:hypothetical protein
VAVHALLGHAVYPNDFKNRDHYYLSIEMINNEIESENTANKEPPFK